MTHVIGKIVTCVKLAPWVKVKVHEMVCCHDQFWLCHVLNNHLVTKIKVMFRTRLGEDLDRFNLSMG
jgi:hypothetical protein